MSAPLPPWNRTSEPFAELISAEAISARVAELGAQITKDYAARAGSNDVVVIGVLKGSVIFLADLVRQIAAPIFVEFIGISSYGDATVSSGVVQITQDLSRPIEGKHVIVVEDIVDSGLTLSWLLKYLESRTAASVEVVALLRKPDAIKVQVPVKYVGFDIPSEFVVGYGLDFAERYRELPYVGVLKSAVYARA
jgi:hypoxanthine phosphoribosyltransferase